jgi:hypothetical protein
MRLMKGNRRRVRRSRTTAGQSAILYIGGMDDDVQEKAERVDKDMPLAARDFLARIKALRVERGAPF